jgi:protein-disulfide isomerase
MKHPIMAAFGMALLAAAVAAGRTSQEHVTGYALGPADAAVVVTEFSDFGCPYCGVFARTVFPELKDEFVETGLVRWLHVPFVLNSSPASEVAARAAGCAGDEGAFWAMHDRLFNAQAQWQGASEVKPVLARYAREIGLDARSFDTCMAGSRADVDRAAEMALVVGVRMTPTFFINGARLEGALPLEEWRQLLHEELAGG